MSELEHVAFLEKMFAHNFLFAALRRRIITSPRLGMLSGNFVEQER